ncbi:hypothetical protein [Zooshikella harenae]|uniref:DegT/DnrJ/EryC1/StrS aminotransferase family protein n=1 Tax=Zooshikella harenae TaxID=2827238 RepID=A0ABS5ZAS7_9GAMM|nr:hypothetical protein [Zooshikella harenae]MBU2711167.1 hypothetical protein [Zooshikella harenae]
MNNNLSLGGFFGLELKRYLPLYKDVTQFHLARQAVYWVVKQKQWKVLWLPYYICPEVTNWLAKIPVKLAFYSLKPSFELTSFPALDKQSGLLWINYFGIHSEYQQTLFKNVPKKQCIIDNCQALFSPPLPNTATVYSPRKFVGVSDGAWLTGNIDQQLVNSLPQASSWSTCGYLLKRLDLGPEPAFTDYQQHEKQLDQAPLQRMSILTDTLLHSIDYTDILHRREDNFDFWHQRLQAINNIIIPKPVCPALSYPLLVDTPKLKSYLLKHRVYIPTYWPGLDVSVLPPFEKTLMSNLCCLPMDQRYSKPDLEKIYQLLVEFGL